MSKKDLIFGIVGLVLVFAMLVGLIALIGNYDTISEKIGSSIDSILDSSDTDKNNDDTDSSTNDSTNAPTTDSTDSSSSGSNESSGTSSGGSTAPSFYMSGDIGYITQNGVTTFFVVASAPEDMNINTPGGCYDTWSLTLNNTTVYDGCTISNKWSVDGGETWNTFGSTGSRLYVSNSTNVYLAYTEIENCADPISYLNKLRTNIFDDKLVGESGQNGYSCQWCQGAYTTYEKFTWSAYHQQIPNEDGSVG